ncbi:MAG: bifunctional DNA-formamidopyrimidine glycosylase/DNA-(apurinic or apyrimidinic site) lyase [Patescibacteria group bacterium]
MPELPEVETVVVGLRRLLPGHKVIRVKFDWPKSFQSSEADTKQFLFGAEVIDVRRRAKTIIIDLTSGYSLVIHLKMTGQLVYVQKSNKSEHLFGAGHPNDSLLGDLPDKTTRVEFELDDHAMLFFNDVRKFGWVRLLPTATLDEVNFLKKLGPDALSVDVAEFVKLFKVRKKSIKACLLDQTIVAGCGNIYADEALWMSQIHPSTKANNLSKKKLTELHANLQDVLRLSIQKGGSSNKNYVNAEGRQGSYLDFANVYQRADEACNRCGDTIKRIVVAGRGTHICESCQRKAK